MCMLRRIDENVKLCVRQVQKQGAYRSRTRPYSGGNWRKLLHQPGDEINRNNEQRRLQIVKGAGSFSYLRRHRKGQSGCMQMHYRKLDIIFPGEAGSCASKPDASGKESGGHQPQPAETRGHPEPVPGS